MKRLLLLAGQVLWTYPCFAADTAAPEAKSPLVTLLSYLIPLMVVIGLMMFVVKSMSKRNRPYPDRSMIHMEKIE
jgi:heme/copper-type cytochrome/quinol oxidase subunit 2